ncbi:MAG: NAD-dependent epimerase/dehydratase family protein [Myxococcota bacterium]
MNLSIDCPPLSEPPWGQEYVNPNPYLAERVERLPSADGEPVVVLGACGALGPDLVQALILKGHRVLGVDVDGTYLVPGASYGRFDLRSRKSVGELIDLIRSLGATVVYNLATIQTSPRSERHSGRSSLTAGVDHLLDGLCTLSGDIRFFHMSTAEVYGAPEGAPYTEEHAKHPFNAYARMKWEEETSVLAAHGRQTRGGGRLFCVALRCWTISMINYDGHGEIAATRNFNDPFIVMATALAEAGARIPVVAPEALCQFHPAEEIVEQALLLTERELGAGTWGRAFNSIGRPASHGDLALLSGELMKETRGSPPWWGHLARPAFARGRLPRPLLVGLAHGLEKAGGLLGARDVAGRLPFLYRSTDIDASSIRSELGDALLEPMGTTTEEAVRRLVLGIVRGGSGAINMRRYRIY